MNPNIPSNTNKAGARIMYYVLAGIGIVMLVVAFRCAIDCGRSTPTQPPIQDTDVNQMSMINDFTIEQSIDVQVIEGMDIEERSTDIKVIYPDGHIFVIDSNYIEPVTDISKVDINFDGVQDVRIDLSMGAYNMGTDFYVQDKNTRKFKPYSVTGFAEPEEYDVFPGLGGVTFDAESRTLKSFFKGRGVGDIYSHDTYQFIDGAWRLITKEFQDTYDIPGAPAGDGWGPYYKKEVVDYTKNPPATTTIYLELKTISDQFEFVEIKKPTGGR
jgi:hypothetical protein